MTPDRQQQLVAALATSAQDDVAALMADVRREARRRAQERLVEAYTEALVRAATRQPAEPSPQPHTWATSGASRGCYVYAVVSGDGTGADAAEGIEPGGPVEVISVGDISAVVSEVDVDVMRTHGANPDVADDGWLARAARAHEGVVCAAFRSAPTIPMRFGVVHPTRDDVERLLGQHADSFRRELQRLEGTAEWGVKIYADRRRLASYVGSARDVAEPAADGGRAYLLRERARRTVDQEIQAFVAERVAQITTSLEQVATDAVTGPVSAVVGEAPVFSGFYLVSLGDESQLEEIVGNFAGGGDEAGLTTQLSGPWPAYHFTSLRLEAHRA